MPEPTLYLFDGYNLLHQSGFADRRALTDALASFVALRGARGVLVWDGVGSDTEVGRLSVRYARHADALLERLAAEHRDAEVVCLVSSDAAVRGTSGQEVQKRSSRAFVAELEPSGHEERHRSRLEDALDAETRARLEQLRRGRQ
ncbi:MAG: NYN domain-containing protein [Actinomycetota bacterium]|nr:NYN domain-containing protein [Actinomycetota bacterium]